MYLNENQIGDKAAKKLAELLNDPIIKLKELGVRWNVITAIGGNAIANALENNEHLKFLDIAWNSVGVRPPENKKRKEVLIMPGEVGSAWGAAFLKNTSLIHLDLSFNKIDLRDSETFSADL